MSETTVTPKFIARLQAGYTEARDRRVQRLLSVAGDLDSADYLYAAFAWAPREMRFVLKEIASSPNAPLHERATAAAHLLHGTDKGWWQMSDMEIKQARALVAAHEKEKPMKRETPMRAAALAAPLDHASPISVEIAIMRECSTLERALGDPAATPATKLDAITRYFQMMACLAPDRLPDSIRKANATLRAKGSRGVQP